MFILTGFTFGIVNRKLGIMYDRACVDIILYYYYYLDIILYYYYYVDIIFFPKFFLRWNFLFTPYFYHILVSVKTLYRIIFIGSFRVTFLFLLPIRNAWRHELCTCELIKKQEHSAKIQIFEILYDIQLVDISIAWS